VIREPYHNSFYFIFLPYTLPHESGESLPRLHGVHGVFKQLDDLVTREDTTAGNREKDEFFSVKQMAITYEAMGDIEKAANFYEGAAKETMNPEQVAEFKNKAKELRQKVGIVP